MAIRPLSPEDYAKFGIQPPQGGVQPQPTVNTSSSIKPITQQDKDRYAGVNQPSKNGWSITKAPEEDKGWLRSLAKGITDTVTQPAEAVQKLGTGLGEFAAKHIKLPYEKEIAQDLDLTKEKAQQAKTDLEGGVKPVQNLEEAAGVALQAGANLATPLTLAAGPLAFAGQSAALSAGKAMEENKGLSDVAVDAAVGGAVGLAAGKASKLAGGVIGKGTQALKEAAAPIMEKVVPYLSNIPKPYIKFATKNPEIVIPKMKVVAEGLASGDQASVESALREQLLTKAKTIYGAAKESAEAAYQKGRQEVEAKFPDAKGSLEAMRGAFRQIYKETGQAVTQDEKTALKALGDTIGQHTDPSISGFIKLKQGISQIEDRLEQGTPGYRIAGLMADEVDKELDRMTMSAMKPINKAYALFKKDINQIRPVWSSSVKEDQARNFVQSLENQAKGGSLDAIKRLEKMAGQVGTSLADEIKATKIAKAFNWEKAPPGSRLRDQLISSLFGAVGGTVGASLGGDGGSTGAKAGIGASIGYGLGAAVTSPAMLSKLLMKQFETSGVPMTSELRQKIGEIAGQILTPIARSAVDATLNPEE